MIKSKYVFLAAIVLVGSVIIAYMVTSRRSLVATSGFARIQPSPSLMPLPPIKVKPEAIPPVISAESYIVVEASSSQVLVAKNPHERLMPASTTKMMTALVALKAYDLEEVVTIGRASEAIGHAIEFIPGEQLRAGDLIKAMLINSGNDAAIALADHHPEGYSGFVKAMNQTAIAFGLPDTHFSNVSGVEADDHYSSAADLAVIAARLMDSPTLRNIVNTKTATVYSVDRTIVHPLENLNRLLWDVPGVIGIKTGWTEAAKDCLVTYTRRDHDIITVVLKSDDRFADSSSLIEWVYANLEE